MTTTQRSGDGGVPAGPELMRLLESAVQVADDSIVITDADLRDPGPRILFVNPAFTAMTGWAPEEVVGRSPRLLQGPETDRGVLERLNDDLRAGRTFQGETVNYRKDGTPFALSWSVSPIHDDEGRATHYVAVQQDVTDRRAEEEHLRDQTRNSDVLRWLFTSLAAELDLDRLIQTVTDSATLLAGAQFGACFLNVAEHEDTGEGDEPATLVALTGLTRPEFDDLGLGGLVPAADASGSVPRDVLRVDDLADHLTASERPRSVRSWLAVPVLAGSSGLFGGLYFGHPAPGVFTEADEELAVGLAAQAAIAIQDARLFEGERRVAETLQRSLLPGVLPEVEGLDVCARYFPGAAGLDIGGDWYDLMALSDGAVGLGGGDVTGRGLGAASVMGQLRLVMRSHALECMAPGDVLDRLNRLCLTDDKLATACYAIVDPGRRSMRYATAGHLPPALVHTDGSVGLLDAGRSVPGGVVADAEFTETTVALEPGSTILLYTDALIERRDESLDAGLARLRTALAAVGDSLDVYCDAIAEELLPRDVHPDDTAFLVLRIR